MFDDLDGPERGVVQVARDRKPVRAGVGRLVDAVGLRAAFVDHDIRRMRKSLGSTAMSRIVPDGALGAYCRQERIG